MACFILFLIFSYSFTYTTATFSSIYYLNSTLPSTWVNSDSINMNISSSDGTKVRPVLVRQKTLGFACGFVSVGSSYLFSIVVIGGGDPAVVWSAKRDRLVQENAVVQLKPDGNLVLNDSNGSRVWSTGTEGKSVAGMNLTGSGNLVLFNDEGTVVWQSFDHPTDTLLAGQRLYEGQQLISSSSPTNWSEGLYYATLTMDSGFSTYTQVAGGEPQMYYQLTPQQSSVMLQSSLKGQCRLVIRDETNSSITSDGLTYPELQTGGFLVNMGTSYQDILSTNRSQLSLDSYIEYIRLDSEGHLKLYRRINNGTGQIELLDIITRDLGKCQHPRVCGNYGLCNEGKCSCPNATYFKQFQPQMGFSCSSITPLSCRPDELEFVEVKNVSYFNFIDPTTNDSNIKDMDGCKKACKEECSCRAAFFRYEKNASDGICYMPSEVLSIREGKILSYNFTSAAYIKVKVSTGPAKRKQGNLIAVIAGSASAVLVIVVVIIVFLLKYNKARTEDGEDDYLRQVPGMPVRFSYQELQVATRDFKEKLGSGGFGSVYKGVLQDGTHIAVKRLDKLGHGLREFLAEVETIGSIHHFNLVRLIGFCAEKSRSLLVYEYMNNGSLDNWIFYPDQRRCLDWETRKKIVLDIARGLAYLHEECRQRIIHLDIKPQNILLDENFNAKISDFGLSKLIDREESQVLTTLRGTPGYIAPECGHSRITVKVDIYSFGIVLLEIVCGRRNLDRARSESSKHLLGLLQKKGEEDLILDVVEDLDEELGDHREEMTRMIRIAVWCLQNDPTKRPLMSTVVKVLEGVMEVDPNISFKFIHAMGMGSSSLANDHYLVSAAPQASVLSNPR